MSEKQGPEKGARDAEVPHEGNTLGSHEEAAEVEAVIAEMRERTRHDAQGRPAGRVSIDDIIFVAPFNMQVRLLRDRLPAGARVASVDKFQGQQAPVVVVTLCRSADESESGGRGLEFVLDPNRLNVAISRAQSLAVVVGDGRMARGPARSLGTMRRLNLLARVLRQARHRER